MHKKVKKTLMNAVVNDTIENIKNLFNKHILKLDDSYFDYNLLKAAVRRNYIEVVQFLLNIGCRVVKPNRRKSEESVLHTYIKNVQHYDRDDIIVLLVDRGASLYDKNVHGQTPVCAAFKNRQFMAAKALLNNCHPKRKSLNEDDLLHFHIACVLNKYNCANRYLKCGIDQNCPISLDFEECAGLNPIELAIKKHYDKLFEFLVKNIVDLSIKDAEGLTPLHKIYYASILDEEKSWIHQVFNCSNDTKFINSKDKYGVSHFHLCSMIHAPYHVQVFINKGVNVNHSVSNKCPVNPGFTALHFAVENGCEFVINLLLKNGANPNKEDMEGKTPLHLACTSDYLLNTHIVRMLLKYKGSPTFVNKNNSTVLHETFCCKNSEQLQVFNMLVSKLQWASNNYTDKQGLSFFHMICTTNKIDEVAKFLNSGVDVNSCVTAGIYRGFTALHFAVMYNQKKVVRILLKHNANVNTKAGESGVTPLHLACEFHYMKFDKHKFTCDSYCYNPIRIDCRYSRKNQKDIIKMLLSRGSDVNAKDTSGATPLLHVSMIDKSYSQLDWTYLNANEGHVIIEISLRLKEIIEILIYNGANINARTNTQSTILHILAKYKTLKILDNFLEFLMTTGADLNAVNDAGFTPLHVSVECSNKLMVRRLLKYNANPNVISNNFLSPLHMAIKKIGACNRKPVEEDIINTLLEHGADVNVKYEDGSVMSHIVLSKFNYSIFQSLLNYGADINVCSSSGKSFASHMFLKKQEMMYSYGKKFEVIYIHVQKLLALGLPVSREIKKACIRLYPPYKKQYQKNKIFKNLDNVLDECISELEIMKSIKIDFYTSLYDILRNDSHELAKYISNDKLTKVLKVQSVNDEFPLYGFLLKLQFNRGLRRSQVLQSAEAALEKVLNVHLPYLCFDLVLKNLTNEEIINLKKAAPTKRNLKRNIRKSDSDQTEPKAKLQKKEQEPKTRLRLPRKCKLNKK